jgi:beta-lactamase superfamily II metal-dependent hydrolase
MSKVKSFSVGDGDMFYINHGSSNFSIIDCFLSDDNKKSIVNELKNQAIGKDIQRFISTHPDEDHIQLLDYLDDQMPILNFYCVKNEATKKVETSGFVRYCELRDDSSKAFFIYKDCSRKWMNQSGPDNNGKEIGSSGINILWPNTDNQYFKDALKVAKDGESPNNISPIITYSVTDGAIYQWMGDLETTFMENIKDDVSLYKVNILFAPHHGRDSGKIPKSMLDILKPDIIIIGEAPSANLNYYQGYNTITQNSAGDITFVNDGKEIHIYVSNQNYTVDFLKNRYKSEYNYYLGTLDI